MWQTNGAVFNAARFLKERSTNNNSNYNNSNGDNDGNCGLNEVE